MMKRLTYFGTDSNSSVVMKGTSRRFLALQGFALFFDLSCNLKYIYFLIYFLISKNIFLLKTSNINNKNKLFKPFKVNIL